MLCADSCFSKTLKGGSGYQVASDKKPHNEKREEILPGGLEHTCERPRTNTDISNTSNMCVHTQPRTHTERGARSMSQISD